MCFKLIDKLIKQRAIMPPWCQWRLFSQ